jgi:hypothetical protein
MSEGSLYTAPARPATFADLARSGGQSRSKVAGKRGAQRRTCRCVNRSGQSIGQGDGQRLDRISGSRTAHCACQSPIHRSSQSSAHCVEHRRRRTLVQRHLPLRAERGGKRSTQTDPKRNANRSPALDSTTHTSTHSAIHSTIHSEIRSTSDTTTESATDSSTNSTIQPKNHSATESSIHSWIQPQIQSLSHSTNGS